MTIRIRVRTKRKPPLLQLRWADVILWGITPSGGHFIERHCLKRLMTGRNIVSPVTLTQARRVFASAVRLPPFLNALDVQLHLLFQFRREREGALEILFGFGVLALPQQSQPAIPVSQGVARVEFDGSIEVVDRAFQFILVAQHYSAAVVAWSEARIERNGLVAIFHRAFAVPFRAPGKAAIEIDRLEARVDRDRAVKIGEGAIEIFFIHIRVAAIVVSVGVARVDRDRAVEIHKRAFVIPQGVARDAAIVVCDMEARVDRNRAVAVGYRALVIAESITRQPAIGVRRRRQRVEYSDLVEIRRRAGKTRIALPVADVQSRADLDGFGEIGDRALEIAFLVERTAPVEMIVRGARRLSKTRRREKAHGERSLRDRVKFHTQLSSEMAHYGVGKRSPVA